MSKSWMLLGLMAVATTVCAQAPSAAEQQQQVEQFVQSLHFRSGAIAVPAAEAHFNLGPQFRYLEQADARRVVEQLWGNPPDEGVLGLVVPAATPLSDTHAWAVVVTRADDGHVSDEDAAKTDYTKLLKQMQDGTREDNDERRKAGYPAMQLVGWAVPPRYDAASKKLYWARELQVEGASQPTLNYDIRVLGRSGYLSLNAVADMRDLATVQDGMQQLLPSVEFDPGKRYADYQPGSDKLAAYGVAALIGGGIAAKAGLFAKLGALLLAGKKLVVLLLAGIAGLWRKFTGRGRSGAVR
jgi:uncharacterized membrane-anchored protein